MGVSPRLAARPQYTPEILIIAHPTCFISMMGSELFEGIHYYVVEENVKDPANVSQKLLCDEVR